MESSKIVNPYAPPASTIRRRRSKTILERQRILLKADIAIGLLMMYIVITSSWKIFESWWYIVAIVAGSIAHVSAVRRIARRENIISALKERRMKI